MVAIQSKLNLDTISILNMITFYKAFSKLHIMDTQI